MLLWLWQPVVVVEDGNMVVVCRCMSLYVVVCRCMSLYVVVCRCMSLYVVVCLSGQPVVVVLAILGPATISASIQSMYCVEKE